MNYLEDFTLSGFFININNKLIINGDFMININVCRTNKVTIVSTCNKGVINGQYTYTHIANFKSIFKEQINDGEMNNGEMNDDEINDEEMNDGEMNDGEINDDAMNNGVMNNTFNIDDVYRSQGYSIKSEEIIHNILKCNLTNGRLNGILKNVYIHASDFIGNCKIFCLLLDFNDDNLITSKSYKMSLLNKNLLDYKISSNIDEYPNNLFIENTDEALSHIQHLCRNRIVNLPT